MFIYRTILSNFKTMLNLPKCSLTSFDRKMLTGLVTAGYVFHLN